MAVNQQSMSVVAVEKLAETIERMDERWYEAIKEMRTEFKLYQEKTDTKLEKMNELLGKLVHIDTEVKEGSKRVHHRMDEIDKKVEKISEGRTNGGCPVFREYKAHVDGLNLEERLKTIEGKGSKRWEVVVNKVIEWAVVFVIGAILVYIGVKK